MVLGMDLTDLATLFEEARRRTHNGEFVVGGSLTALGVLDSCAIPPRMLMSIDVRCFTRNDPGRIFELNAGVIASRFRETTFLDNEERDQAFAALARDQAQANGGPPTSR